MTCDAGRWILEVFAMSILSSTARLIKFRVQYLETRIQKP